jgi:hypothetical protein
VKNLKNTLGDEPPPAGGHARESELVAQGGRAHEVVEVAEGQVARIEVLQVGLSCVAGVWRSPVGNLFFFDVFKRG